MVSRFPLLIFGAGGLGPVVLDTLRQAGAYEPVAFLDNDPARHGRSIDGLVVRGGIEQSPRVRASGVTHAIVAIGEMKARRAIAGQLQQLGFTLASAVHPLTSVASSAQIGAHVILGARVTVCVHARVGDHAILSSGCIVEHDNVLADGVLLQPAVRLAGGVRVGEQSVLGVGACVIPYRSIGAFARVAPGSVVVTDVPDHVTVAGVPARPLTSTRGWFVADAALPRLAGGAPAADAAPTVGA